MHSLLFVLVLLYHEGVLSVYTRVPKCWQKMTEGIQSSWIYIALNEDITSNLIFIERKR